MKKSIVNLQKCYPTYLQTFFHKKNFFMENTHFINRASTRVLHKRQFNECTIYSTNCFFWRTSLACDWGNQLLNQSQTWHNCQTDLSILTLCSNISPVRKTFLLILLVETSIQFNFIDLIIDNYQWCFNFKNCIELIKPMPVLNLMSLDKSWHPATVPCRKNFFFLLLAKLFPCCSTSVGVLQNRPQPCHRNWYWPKP